MIFFSHRPACRGRWQPPTRRQRAGGELPASRCGRVEFHSLPGELGTAHPAHQDAQTGDIFTTEATKEVTFGFVDPGFAPDQNLASRCSGRDQHGAFVELGRFPFDEFLGLKRADELAHGLCRHHRLACQVGRRYGLVVRNQVEDHVLTSRDVDRQQTFVEPATNELLDLLDVEEGASANGHRIPLVVLRLGPIPSVESEEYTAIPDNENGPLGREKPEPFGEVRADGPLGAAVTLESGGSTPGGQKKPVTSIS